MVSNIQKGIENILLRGYAEFDTNLKDLSLQEEQSILARLILAQQICFFSITEYMNFRDFRKIKPKVTQGFKKMFLLVLIFVSTIIYGLVQFILNASQDESLRPQVIIAMFQLTVLYNPLLQGFMYFWQTENMVKLITQYMNTCRALSDNSRKFYGSLTLKRNICKYLLYSSIILGGTYLILRRNLCFQQDRRFVCGIYLPLWFPVETNYFPVRELIVVVTILTSCPVALLSVHHTVDAYILAELFEYKCQNLIKLMKETSLSREQNDEKVKQKFRDIIDYHKELNGCFVLIRDILGGVSAPGITIFIPLSATISVAFTMDFNFGYLLEFLVVVGICYMWIDAVQRITDLGEFIQGTAYDMNWFEMDKTMNKEFLIFLTRLQRPFEMQSMLFVLKKPMFLSMIRSVYSCVMLMLQMN